jgi:anti-sigma28 factor (negative regulator of flagellin synthesis)
MKINPLTNNPYFSQGVPGKTSDSKGNAKNSQAPQDKLELSDQAMKIQNNSSEDKKINNIKTKIANNFYNSDVVINKVADNILKELRPNYY